jgi:hypothetical protein
VRRQLWRFWPVLITVAAVLAILAVHLAAEWLKREPPNYTRIEAGLYLGGRVQQPPPDVRAVLNLCGAEDPDQAPVHRWEPIRDAEPVPTIDWLRRQVEFIEAQRQAGRAVLVHCRNGVSRSGMVVVAYLMARHHWSRDEALLYVRSRRPAARPNPAFLRLLLEWEQSRRHRLDTRNGE